jgi:homogentisate 1,2-dioxygenase
VRYHELGTIPAKRHVQFRHEGKLLTEEVVGFEGFSGNESILYHLNSPCRILEAADFTPIVRDEWIPQAHVHRLLQAQELASGGDPIFGRHLLMHNADVEIALCKPAQEQEGFYRNGEGDEVLFIHEGSGVVETSFGDVPYRPHDYVVIPRGTTYRVAMDSDVQTWLVFFTPGEIETPKRYRNRYGQLLEGAPFSQRDFHPPQELRTHDETGEFVVVVRARAGYQRYVLDYHPFDVVGWDGYVYPYTFNADDFEPIVGRVHQPPPVHQTFQGPNFVICSFCPRPLDFDPGAVPLPYHHSNLQSEEVIYYVEGSFGSRRGVSVGSLTLHPSGLPHGPQPGRVEQAIGQQHTDELAVMCDTFRPLKLSRLSAEIDEPAYAYSWSDRPSGAPVAGLTTG